MFARYGAVLAVYHVHATRLVFPRRASRSKGYYPETQWTEIRQTSWRVYRVWRVFQNDSSRWFALSPPRTVLVRRKIRGEDGQAPM